MFKRILAAVVLSSTVPGAASAAQIVQTFGGTAQVPSTLNLFDSSLGTLTSVTATYSFEASGFVPNSAGLGDQTLPASGFFSLSFTPGPVIASGALTSTISYLAGEAFGQCRGSAAGVGTFSSNLSSFVGTGSLFLSGGGAVAGCTSLGSTFSGRLTYEYASSAGAVPEPGTWLMMMLGFGIIGITTRRRAVLDRMSATIRSPQIS
jgi:hypothetical protein